tara:strand:+ start:517 stop:651 length:135 start_codon:yes stop_codon:yes gene_type:complete
MKIVDVKIKENLILFFINYFLMLKYQKFCQTNSLYENLIYNLTE